MTNITLNGTTPVQVQQVAASGFSLQNTGPGNAYLGNDASVTPSTGYIVAPGVSLPLNANTVLYACTDNGKTAAIQLLQGATATQATIVEANVPNAINANITNPSIQVSGSVNANIQNASLPVTGTVNANIQNASIPVTGNVGITSGTVAISSGSVSVNGGQVGTAAANHPTLIDTITFTLPTGAQSNSILFNKWYSTAGYSSFIMVLTGGGSGGALLAVGNYFKGFVSQAISVPDNAHIIDTLIPQWLMDQAQTVSIKVPVRADNINFQLNNTKAATSVTYPYTVYIFGSSEQISDPYYQSSGSLFQPGAPNGSVYSYTNTSTSGSHSDFVASTNGPCALNLYGSGSVGNVAMYVCDSGATKGIAALYTSSGVNGQIANLNLPLLPILIVSTLTSGSTVSSLSQ